MKDGDRSSDRRLDELLERAGSVEEPAELVARVRRGLAGAREEERLDRLLDRLPDPQVPSGLAGWVLTAVADERHASRRRGPLFFVAPVLATAALVLVALGVFWLTRSRREPLETHVAVAEEAPEELLEVLDVLESWEFLTTDDIDLLMAGLDAGDETLLELDEEEREEG